MRRLLFLVVALIATAPVTQAAQADEMLRRKPGLWKLTVTSVATQLNTPPETKETTAELCTDNAIDVLLYSHDPCQGQLSHKLALSANRELTCNLGVEKMSVHSTTTLTAGGRRWSAIGTKPGCIDSVRPSTGALRAPAQDEGGEECCMSRSADAMHQYSSS
jgi:hypothetical protein